MNMILANGRPSNAGEQTGPQTVHTQATTDPVLPRQDGFAWFCKARKMRRDPTIAMVRQLSIAPALAAGWSVEEEDDAPEGAKDFIDEQMMPHRMQLLKQAFLGTIDFGWQSFEKVFTLTRDMQIGYKKFKPLLPDFTEILIFTNTGAFAGLRNDPSMGARIDLPRDKSLLFAIDVEGTDWYGEAILRNVEGAYDEWLEVNKAANRFDRKVAGSTWVVHYPPGQSLFNGSSVDNSVIAKDILDKLEASGAVTIPRWLEALTPQLDKDTPDAWKFELLSSSISAKAAFIERQSYLDKLKVRGFFVPERAVLEGQFGTKAEASAHADFAITVIELRHQFFVQDINRHCVDQLLRVNYGEEFEGTVRIVPNPLADPDIALFKDVYTRLLQSPQGFFEVFDQIDLNALADKLGVPQKPENEDDEVDINDDPLLRALRERSEGPSNVSESDVPEVLVQ